MPKINAARWRRVFNLRRAFVEQIVWAGMLDGKPKVSLRDELDDVIFVALENEERIVKRRQERKTHAR